MQVHRGNTGDRLAAKFEAWLAPKPPWTSAKVTPARRNALLQAIVAIEMDVATIEGSFKLNQTKSEADRAAIARALASGDAAAQTIAARMRALQSHSQAKAAGDSAAGHVAKAGM